MGNRKFAPAALGRVILALLFVAALSSCGTTAVTDEVLTPTSTGMAYMPRLYPVMMERHDFKDRFQLTKKQKMKSMADMYYDDTKKLFQRNFEINYSDTGGDVYGYVRCDGADIKIRHNGWYCIPAILTATLCWAFGCPVVDAIATCQARFSVLDCEGNVVKTITVEGKGRSSGSFYAMGKDIARHASIKAYKKVLEELNAKMGGDADMLTLSLNRAAEGLEKRRMQAAAEAARPNSDYSLGIKLLQASDNGDAVAVLSKVIAASPCHYPAYFFRGLAYVNTGQYSKALADFRQASLLSPEPADAFYYQSYLLQKLRRSEEAYVPMLKAVEANPDNVNYRVLYAGLLEGDGRWAEAKRQYRRVLEINPDMVEVYDWIERVDRKEAENAALEVQRSMQILERQSQMLQVYTQTMTNLSGSVSPSGASSSGTGSSASGVPSGRSRESIQRDLDKAKKLLSDMTKNQERNSSLVDQQIYNGMIQRQEQKIYELEEELRLAE